MDPAWPALRWSSYWGPSQGTGLAGEWGEGRGSYTMLKWKMVGSHLGSTIVLKMQCLALWQSLSATGSILASSKCYTTLVIGTLPFWSTANCEGICWWGKYKKTNVYMVTLRNHSAVIYSSHKNLKHRFFKSNFPIYSMVPVRAWTETLELHALKLLSAYQLKCTCVGLHTVSLHVSLQTTARITGEQRWTHGPVHF